MADTATKLRAAKSAAQTAREIYRILGPAIKKTLTPYKLGAPWTYYASNDQLLRAAKLTERIERYEALARDARKERRRIMQTCVRRMRRERGVE